VVACMSQSPVHRGVDQGRGCLPHLPALLVSRLHPIVRQVVYYVKRSRHEFLGNLLRSTEHDS
jgi:hypothetical protein